MEQDTAGFSPIVLWGIILATTLSALGFVLFFILPNCATLPVRGNVSGECGVEQMGIIGVSSAMFLAAAVFSVYRLASTKRLDQ